MNADPKRFDEETSESEADLERLAKRLAKDRRVLARIKASESDLKNNRVLTTEQVFARCRKISAKTFA